MRHVPPCSLAFVALLAACSPRSSSADLLEPVDSSAALTIAVEKTSYTWAEASVGSGPGVRGTIANTSDRNYSAKLGDGFAGLEQELLYIANASDGTIERAEGATWVAVSGAQLIEGVRDVVLRSGRTYSFIAHVSGEKRVGTYRLVVAFRDGGEHRVVSRTFEIR